jgi:hypothetical protein
VKRAKQDGVASPEYRTFLAGLKALNKEALIKKVSTLNAAATSGWVPRAIALGELYNREGLVALPARQRTRRLREIASQTRVSINTARQDVRLRDAFFGDEAAAAKWFACEPIEREAFVTALAAPETLAYAYEAFTRGVYDRAEFRRYVKSQVAGSDPEAKKEGEGVAPQRIRGLPPEVRAALDRLKTHLPELRETDLLLKAIETLRRQRNEGRQEAGGVSRTLAKELKGRKSAASTSRSEHGTESAALALSERDGKTAEGAASSSSGPKTSAASPLHCRSPAVAE